MASLEDSTYCGRDELGMRARGLEFEGERRGSLNRKQYWKQTVYPGEGQHSAKTVKHVRGCINGSRALIRKLVLSIANSIGFASCTTHHVTSLEVDQQVDSVRLVSSLFQIHLG